MSSAVSASSDASSSRDRILGFGNKRSFVRDDVAVGTKYLDTVRGVKLHCRYWRRVTDTDDEGDIKGLLFLSHGYGEHLEWYYELASLLAAEKHLLVFGHDHVGHGLSDGERANVKDMDEYVNDVFHHVAAVRLEYKGLPCFIYGHSMGGLVAIRCIRRNPGCFKGAVLEAPLIKFPEEINWAEYYLGKLAGYFFPSFTSLRYISEKNITGDVEMQRRIADDPLWYKGALKLQMGVTFVEAVKDLTIYELSQITVPLLILHGDLDVICSPSGSTELHRMAKSSDKALITFQSAHHHLIIERADIRKQAIAETGEWIAQRL
jgi:acylglycerol lipase